MKKQKSFSVPFLSQAAKLSHLSCLSTCPRLVRIPVCLHCGCTVGIRLHKSNCEFRSLLCCSMQPINVHVL